MPQNRIPDSFFDSDRGEDAPAPEPEETATPQSGSEARRDRRDYGRGAGGDLLDRLMDWIGRYIVLPRPLLLLVAAWVQSAHLAEIWDRFGHLTINSPVMQCGKTQLLKLLRAVCPGAKMVVSTTAAATYRSVTPTTTLILDEAQSLFRVGSEAAALMRELFCGSIERDATVERCTGQGHEPTVFTCYCAKVMAFIGPADATLADRCLLVSLRRKTKNEGVKAFKLRAVKAEGEALRKDLAEWAATHEERVKGVYDAMEESIDPDNDRMSELFQPLLAVLRVQCGEDHPHLKMLEECARDMAASKSASDGVPNDVLLLAAIKEVFAAVKDNPKDGRFITTAGLIDRLCEREEEPWATWVRGRRITAEALANLLRPFGVKSLRNHSQTCRGYVASSFEDVWSRYVAPPSVHTSNPSTPADTPVGYAAYLKTPWWLGFSRRVIRHWGNRCAICYADGKLSVHHRVYERLGHEEMTDVIALCQGCHAAADKARREAKAKEVGQ